MHADGGTRLAKRTKRTGERKHACAPPRRRRSLKQQRGTEMRAINTWAIASVLAGALSFAVAPVMAQTGGQAGGGQTGGTGQTGTTGQTGGTGQVGGQTGGTDVGGYGGAGNTGAARQPRRANAGNLQDFAQRAAISNLSEIKLGQLAQQNAQDPQVKQFAQQMIDQHTQAQNELQAIATSNGFSLPTSLDARHQKIEDKLSKLQGPAFDRAYIKSQVKAHKQAASLLQKRAGQASSGAQSTSAVGTSGTGTTATAGTSGEVSAIDDYASQTLPKIEQHLQMAKQLENQVKNESRSDQSKSDQRKK